jgi:hypothetical protein
MVSFSIQCKALGTIYEVRGTINPSEDGYVRDQRARLRSRDTDLHSVRFNGIELEDSLVTDGGAFGYLLPRVVLPHLDRKTFHALAQLDSCNVTYFTGIVLPRLISRLADVTSSSVAQYVSLSPSVAFDGA